MLPSEPSTETMPAADNAALVQNAPVVVAEAANNALVFSIYKIDDI
jgi:hypothetical protein